MLIIMHFLVMFEASTVVKKMNCEETETFFCNTFRGLKELRAGYAAGGVGAGGVTFSVAGQKHYQCDCWGLQRESSRHLHAIGLPDFILKLRCFQTVTCYQVK